MKAMVLYEFNKDMIFEEVEPPKLEADELLLKVKACGICYTDVKIISGLIPVINLPHILGHEIAGKVVEIGDKVKDIKVGDKGIVYFYIPCRDCEMCRNARENICYSIKRLGFELPGGYAQYVKVPAYNFCPFNKEISFEEMAILPDAVATPYHALKQMADLKADQNVLVIGIGGLGIHAIQIAFMMGSRVIAADIRDEALEVAKRYGAELLINPLKEDPKKMIRDWTEGKGIDVIIEGVGTPDSFKWALDSLKRGGTLIIMGYDPNKPIYINPMDMHLNEWTIKGSRVSTKQELLEVISFVEQGKIKPIVSNIIPLKDANKGLEEVKKGENLARIVLRVE